MVILQARMTSKRLPGKVMMLLNGEPMIYRQIERILKASTIDKLIVATSVHQSDDVIADFLAEKRIEVFRGHMDDVLSRFIEIGNIINPEIIVRLTADCPLVMPDLIDKMVLKFLDSDLDYLSNTLEPTFPDGLDIEIFKHSALSKLQTFSLSLDEKEHVTIGIYKRKFEFKVENYFSETNLSRQRWTVDYLEDFLFAKAVFNEFKGFESTFTFEELNSFLEKNPDCQSSISPLKRNENLNLQEIGNRYRD